MNAELPKFGEAPHKTKPQGTGPGVRIKRSMFQAASASTKCSQSVVSSLK